MGAIARRSADPNDPAETLTNANLTHTYVHGVRGMPDVVLSVTQTTGGIACQHRVQEF